MNLTSRGSLLLMLLAVLFWSIPAKPQEPDRKMARATFKVLYSQGGNAVVQPVLPVQFRVRRLNGELDKPIATEFVTCDVFLRQVAVDDKKEYIHSFTVLKRGSEEYGIQGVLFAKE